MTFEVKIDEIAMKKLEEDYYTYCARRDMVENLMKSGDAAGDTESLKAYDALYVEAYKNYNDTKEWVTSTELAEIAGNGDYRWAADFKRGVMYVTYSGKGKPNLPASKYVAR